MSLDSIKARLGSVGPMKRYQCGKSVSRLLDADMPKLIKIAEYVLDFVTVDYALEELLQSLERKDADDHQDDLPATGQP